MTQTLDQRRAAFAWECATAASITKYKEEYKVLAKGAPALIMSSGLMPTLAFYNQKSNGKKESNGANQLLDDLIRGLSLQLTNQKLTIGKGSQLFQEFMQVLQREPATSYLRYTDEALELLKWIRQFVDAVRT